MIDKEAPLPVVKQCQLLTVSRSSVYYRGAAVSDEKLAVMRHIDEIHLARPFLGSRRVGDTLRDRGFTVNRNSSPTRGGSSDPYAARAAADEADGCRCGLSQAENLKSGRET